MGRVSGGILSPRSRNRYVTAGPSRLASSDILNERMMVIAAMAIANHTRCSRGKLAGDDLALQITIIEAADHLKRIDG
jgi:hypothetical protein